MDVAQVARDLAAEQQALDEVVAGLTVEQWNAATPSPGWSVSDQIGHLTYYDLAAVRAITEPAAFQDGLEDFWEVAVGGDEALDELTLGRFRAMAPPELLAAWRAARAELVTAAGTLDDETRVSWYGPSMGSKSFLTARLMEVWAHGQDVADAVGATREPTDRLRHIAQLGFLTRSWSYQNRGLDPPPTPVRLELTAPSGDTWRFGRDDATDVVTGPALDFCLVVTQRRHVDDTALEATPPAHEWLLIAQAFAGPPTDGPSPGSRP